LVINRCQIKEMFPDRLSEKSPDVPSSPKGPKSAGGQVLSHPLLSIRSTIRAFWWSLWIGVALGRAAPNDPPAVHPAGDPAAVLESNVLPIDLSTALRLARARNPEILLARQRVVEAAALRQLAAARLLPTLNAGSNYDIHNGPVQQANGNILSVNRSALYVGSGVGATAAGTVPIPGVLLAGNVAEGLYGLAVTRQVVRQREFADEALRGDVLLRVCWAYCELLRAEGHRSLADRDREEAGKIVRLTAAREPADVDRARTERSRREADLVRAEESSAIASARLCGLLSLDPSVRLRPTDAWVVPAPVVPEPIPLPELIAMALLRRPEVGQFRSAIREAMLTLDGAKALPFSPTILLGFSSGSYGGGSNLVQPSFGKFNTRVDFDAVAYWTLRNLGVGNVALVRLAASHSRAVEFQQQAMFDLIRSEVAETYAQTHYGFALIESTERAVESSAEGLRKDLDRLGRGTALPIEALDSLHRLARARAEYLDAIVDYNRAHFRLFIVLGQPPADYLAFPVPTSGGDPRASRVASRPGPGPSARPAVLSDAGANPVGRRPGTRGGP